MSSVQVTQRVLALLVKKLQFRALKRIHIQFDPFHPAATPIREFTFIANIERIRLTNPSCSVKNDIMSDLSTPKVDLTLSDGKKYRLLSENLTLLELVEQVDAICTKFDPKPLEEETVSQNK